MNSTYTDTEKASDSMEHKAVFSATKTTVANETSVTILEDICTRSTTRIHIDTRVLNEIPNT